MLPFPKLLLILLGLNLFGSFVFYFASIHSHSSLKDLTLSTSQDLFTQATQSEPQKFQDLKPEDFSTPISAEKVSDIQDIFEMNPIVDPFTPDQTFTKLTNPFFKIGAYPEIKISLPYGAGLEQLLSEKNYGIENEDDYCERVDYYNLANPQNVFESLNFFTDFAEDTITRRNVIRKIGKDTRPEVNRYNAAAIKDNYTLDVSINNFFMDTNDFHRYHQIGKNFLCATQMYNQIPGSNALVQKAGLIESFNRWVEKHSPRPFCFNDEAYFLKSYRLSIQEECDSFFNKLKSKRYKKSLGSEPIQYILKSGQESRSGDGVYLLDKETTAWLMSEFHSGIKCGSIDTSLIAQTYITNPLLINNTKFDFRVFMLIASTNPFIVYSHDGYLRTAVSPYDKFSTEPEKHLTTTHIAYDAVSEARQHGTYNGKIEKELRDAHILEFEDLQKYLLETGKITDENWLENYLRPQFKKVMIHLVKMTNQFYVRLSNVYGLYGLDFMLDDELNLWFIEADQNPSMTAISQKEGEILNKMVRSMFEIEYGLYRSRMKRAFELISNLKKDEDSGYPVNHANWRAQYLEDEVKNRFEPEFRMSQYNSFSLVMDESLPGPDAYRGYLDIMCVFSH